MPLNEETTELLNSWPKNTIGYQKETILIETLNRLCIEYGYGRVKQLAEQMFDMLNYPENIEKYKSHRTNHLKLLAEYYNTSEEL